MKIIIYSIISFLTLVPFTKKKDPLLKPIRAKHIKVAEPSDISFCSSRNSFFVVGDDGKLYEVTKNGKIIRQAKHKGVDFEGVVVNGDKVFVMEEARRNVLVFGLDSLNLLSSFHLIYDGGRNKGFESLAFNDSLNVFYAFTERDPLWVYIFDTTFSSVQRIKINFPVTDISSARFKNGFLWILSDENATLLKVDTSSFKVIKKWRLPIVNAEGLAFTTDSNLVMVSDAMQKMFWLKLE